jgi:hypothetical protein
MRAIAFALLAIGAEYVIQQTDVDDELGRTLKILVGLSGGVFAFVSLILAIMGI